MVSWVVARLVRLCLAWHRVDRFAGVRLAWHGNVWFGTARRFWVRLARRGKVV
nr:MAG TPA: hypothetical protein [Caudoviricetes sp.]